MTTKTKATPKAEPHAEAPPLGPRTLDDLARLAPRELALLYRAARTPKVADLEGALKGRMLAIPAIGRLRIVSRLVQRYAGSRAFPWQGKTFWSTSEGRGEGKNRVLGDRASWFRFETFVGRSRAGEFDSVHLDYDNPENPAFIRAIEDEVREVAPGLWLGLAYLKVRGKARLALYFALAR
jgi:hypothetical protein